LGIGWVSVGYRLGIGWVSVGYRLGSGWGAVGERLETGETGNWPRLLARFLDELPKFSKTTFFGESVCSVMKAPLVENRPE
jgi:hypothetical protein